MKITEVLNAAKTKQLTYSTIAQLLVEQPTAAEESHAHMHTLDAFKVDTSKIKPDRFQCPPNFAAKSLVQMRKAFWENPELHLHPDSDYDRMKQLKGKYAAPTYDPKNPGTFEPYNFYMDKSRLADNDTYLKRGMAKIDEKYVDVHSQTLIYKPQGGGPTVNASGKIESLAHAKTAPAGAQIIKNEVKTQSEKVHGTFLAMEAHSMFEDSESLVMCTTAVLASDAGIAALQALDGRAAGGSYVAVYSATAVLAVAAAFAKNNAAAGPLKLAERSPTSVTVDPQTKQPRAPGLGQFGKKDIKRVVLVLKPHAAGELIIVTCYPTAKDGQIPALPPLLPPPTAADDVVELDKNADLFQIVKQGDQLDLKW
jgi:hypothetical protein